MASRRRLRFIFALLIAVSLAVGGGAVKASASPPTPRQRGSAAGHADSPRGTAPRPGTSVRTPHTAAPPRVVPGGLTGRAAKDKARADAGFRGPNQKPVATVVPTAGRPATPAAPA